MKTLKWRDQKFPLRIQTPARFKQFTLVGAGGDTRYWLDKKTGIMWREYTCNGPSTWYWARAYNAEAVVALRERVKVLARQRGELP